MATRKSTQKIPPNCGLKKIVRNPRLGLGIWKLGTGTWNKEGGTRYRESGSRK